MAYIRVKKSDSAYTDIPLTEDKPIPPSVEVYSGGKFYYNPLVTSDDYLNSGVRVCRYNGGDYCALATQIYNPITHDKNGASWGVNGTPEITQRGRLHIPSGGYLLQNQTITLSASSYFWISFSFALDSVPGDTQGICAIGCASDTSKYWSFGQNASKKFYSNHNKGSLATWGTATAGTWYRMNFWYDNGTFGMDVDGTYKTVSKALNSTSTTYSLVLGCNNYPSSGSNKTKGITIGAVNYEYGADVDHTIKGCLTFGNI